MLSIAKTAESKAKKIEVKGECYRAEAGPERTGAARASDDSNAGREQSGSESIFF